VKVIEGRRAQNSGASVPPKPAPAGEGGPLNPQETAAGGGFKETLLEEIRKQKKFFYGTVVAQAQRIDVDGDKIVFVFGPQHKALRTQLEQNRPALEEIATQLAGRKISVVSAEGISASGGPLPLAGRPPSPVDAGFGGSAAASKTSAAAGGDQKEALKQRALSDTGVQTMLDVFAAEIKDVEEM
jgi:hypothetical protein